MQQNKKKKSSLTSFARISKIIIFYISGQTTQFFTLKFSTAKIILFSYDFIVTTFISAYIDVLH